MSKLRIEMVHDIVCSWCPIGYNNIQKAIKNLALEVDFQFLPFELNPNMSEEGETIANYFKRHQGWSSATLNDYQSSLVETALKAGVIIDFTKRTHYYNTLNAHKLIHFAAQENLHTAVNEILIKAYFEQGLDISNTSVLLKIAEQVGLDGNLVQALLSSTQVEAALNNKIKRQKSFEISSIPTFILNQDTLVSGSNSVAFFEKTLSKFTDEHSQNQKIAI